MHSFTFAQLFLLLPVWSSTMNTQLFSLAHHTPSSATSRKQRRKRDEKDERVGGAAASFYPALIYPSSCCNIRLSISIDFLRHCLTWLKNGHERWTGLQQSCCKAAQEKALSPSSSLQFLWASLLCLCGMLRMKKWENAICNSRAKKSCKLCKYIQLTNLRGIFLN